MASIRKAKKLGIYKKPKYTKERADLIRETRKITSQVNRRLKGLKNAGYKGTYASKKLINRLDTNKLGAYKKGRVVVPKNATKTELMAIQKASDQFLKSKTSTARGIERTRDATIKSIQSTLSEDKKRKVSFEDAEFYYDMFGNDDFNYFADKIGASTLWALIDDAIENDFTEPEWIASLERYITLNDLDVRERAIRLYEKYVL